MIRPPRASELERLRAIERAAGRAFLDVGMPDIAADAPPSLGTLERYRVAGWSWVVTAGQGSEAPVAGYVLVDVVDGPGRVAGERAAHVEQVSVDPRYGRRGLGRRLLDHVAHVARQRGLDAVTLTTFRDVPWNAPYYERCGFRVLTDDETGPGLRRIRDDEAAHGLDPAGRACMRRELDRP